MFMLCLCIMYTKYKYKQHISEALPQSVPTGLSFATEDLGYWELFSNPPFAKVPLVFTYFLRCEFVATSASQNILTL